MITEHDYSEIRNAYVACALWSSHDVVDGEEVDLDMYDSSDIDEETLVVMFREVIEFVIACQDQRPSIFDGWEPGQIGHDFWLTRNHHGVGFWDRGRGESGDWLKAQCRPWGEYSLYLGDDGKIYGMDG